MPLRNRTIYIGDNLPRLRGIDSETVDLIYLDPPFNSKGEYQWPLGTEDTAWGDETVAGEAGDLSDNDLEAMITGTPDDAFKDAFTLDDLDQATLNRLLEATVGGRSTGRIPDLCGRSKRRFWYAGISYIHL